jgi:hypothetical protein
MIGTIGCTPGRIAKPAAVMRARKYARVRLEPVAEGGALVQQLERRELAPTIGGATVLLNRYGRERWRSSSMISRDRW